MFYYENEITMILQKKKNALLTDFNKKKLEKDFNRKNKSIGTSGHIWRNKDELTRDVLL